MIEIDEPNEPELESLTGLNYLNKFIESNPKKIHLFIKAFTEIISVFNDLNNKLENIEVNGINSEALNENTDSKIKVSDLFTMSKRRSSFS